MNNKWNVVIRRFSGFHAGHKYLIEAAFSLGGIEYKAGLYSEIVICDECDYYLLPEL